MAVNVKANSGAGQAQRQLLTKPKPIEEGVTWGAPPVIGKADFAEVRVITEDKTAKDLGYDNSAALKAEQDAIQKAEAERLAAKAEADRLAAEESTRRIEAESRLAACDANALVIVRAVQGAITAARAAVRPSAPKPVESHDEYTSYSVYRWSDLPESFDQNGNLKPANARPAMTRDEHIEAKTRIYQREFEVAVATYDKAIKRALDMLYLVQELESGSATGFPGQEPDAEWQACWTRWRARNANPFAGITIDTGQTLGGGSKTTTKRSTGIPWWVWLLLSGGAF